MNNESPPKLAREYPPCRNRIPPVTDGQPLLGVGPLPCSVEYAIEAGCSQEEGPKKGFVMGSRTQGVQEILEKCM